MDDLSIFSALSSRESQVKYLTLLQGQIFYSVQGKGQNREQVTTLVTRVPL